ncbi:N-acetylmuramate alpha-1-phosphate uridylyltransferase MurU [uncultured Ferrimonas sp.]|uniref:N-acetylmuramate alpha-1-phosphate uridylyltransferase MurU n=1 Tax=uncultured Ferrimonas sp. TaxID=432640 RepID=UPI00260F6B0A|nr:nucleotidyltransferase family protein [uncultured Ferrimonas sp.]
MKAMILAAGRGERMRPLTDTTPKPLIPLQGKPLIVHHLENLAAAGITEVVINQGHLGEQLAATLGNGSRWGLSIRYSDERGQVLETGGGIHKALSLLGAEPFLLLNGDVYCPYPWHTLALPAGQLAHLLLVPNPDHNPNGDFALHAGVVAARGENRFTYSGCAVLDPQLFAACQPGRFALGPLLKQHMNRGRISGQLIDEPWCDVGTVARLQQLEKQLNAHLG